MLLKHYFIDSLKSLGLYLASYLPLVQTIAKDFDIDLLDPRFHGDHLGLQVVSHQEFDEADHILLRYSTCIHDVMIHNRRNRVYQFHEEIVVHGIHLPRIEIFEPKPGADLHKLKPGIEHIAFTVDDYDELLASFETHHLPIDKKQEYENGSKFFKTSLVNLVEIEFRNDYLGLLK